MTTRLAHVMTRPRRASRLTNPLASSFRIATVFPRTRVAQRSPQRCNRKFARLSRSGRDPCDDEESSSRLRHERISTTAVPGPSPGSCSAREFVGTGGRSPRGARVAITRHPTVTRSSPKDPDGNALETGRPCHHVQVAEGSPPTTPGWYPDPYHPNAQRWFDGTAWTLHAVGTDQANPDQIVEDQWRRPVGDEGSQQEWARGFSRWDTAIPRGTEPAFDFRGGLFGFTATRFARGADRYSATHPGFRIWHVACLVPPALLLLARIDPAQRGDLEIGAVAVAAVCVLMGLASVSVHRHWNQVGRQDPASAA